MKQSKKKSEQQVSRWRFLTISTLGGLMVLLVVQQASAGPITNPLGTPYSKLSVYQGVISVIPSVGGDVMEIGNDGRDIATTGNLVLRPGTIPGTTTSTKDVLIQSPGRLCFGVVSAGTCSNSWASASTPTLDQVLATFNGNFSSHSASLGSASPVAPSAKLVVNNGLAGSVPGSADDALDAYANTTGSAIYAQQSNGAISAFAGYFSGRVAIHDSGNLINSSTLYLYGTGSTAQVLNVNPVNYGDGAATFNGVVNIIGSSTQVHSPGVDPTPGEFDASTFPAALSVQAVDSYGLGPWGIGIYAKGAPISGFSSTTSSIGLYASAPNTSSGFSYGVLAESKGNNAFSYAAALRGRVTKSRITPTIDMSATTIPEVTAYVTTSSAISCSTMCGSSGMSCLLSWDSGVGAPSSTACSTAGSGRRCLCI